MDDKDIRIIEILMENARVTKTNIAKELNITEAAVRKRISNLESRRILLGYKAAVDYKAVGLSASLTGIDVEPENIWKVVMTLKNMEPIKAMWLTTGDHTLICQVVARSIEELSAAHERIAAVEGVKRICPAVILDTLK
ncbi:MAG: Lrp/AsnC family transcriptional regulator [Archaeoglobales archaeon]|nr:Lrp/AsnC family transcriptional regulator [Archaeoglobales archaeon]